MDGLEEALNDLNLDDKDAATRLKLRKLIGEALLENETCSRWIQELPPISSEELRIALEVITNHMEDFARRVFDDESDLQYSATETVTKRCIQAQIHMMNKNFDETASIIAETYHLIQECIDKKYLSPDYVTGYRYVVKCLDIAISLELDKENKNTNQMIAVSKLQDDLNEVNTFHDLKLKDQVGILAIKQYFLGNVNRNIHDKQIQIIKKVIAMDPDCPEWRCCLYALCKFKRDFNESKGPPSEEEKLAILAAYDVKAARFDPRIRLGYAYCLAELLRASWKSFSPPLTYGKQKFYSIQAVLDYIQEEVDDVLSIDPMSVRSNINVAKIYSSILPYPYRNISFSMVCIKRALLFHPTSSKANHRMGILRLSKDSPIQALQYFQRSFEADERNFYALYDLLKSYMGNVEKYRNELNQVFEKVLSHTFYKSVPEKLSQLLFMNAVYKFLDERRDESVDLFVNAYLKHSKSKELFKEIEQDIKRYNWTENKSAQSKSILGELQDCLRKKYTECTCPRQKEILKVLYEASLVRSGYGGREWTRGGGRPGDRARGPRSHTYNRGGGFGARGAYNHQNNYSHGGFNRGGGGFRGSRNHGFSSGDGYNQNKWREESGRGDEKHKKKDENDGFLKYIKTQNHWAVLGVETTATKEEIRKAYKKLAMENHPDKHMDATEKERLEKQERMKIINKAFESLTAKHYPG